MEMLTVSNEIQKCQKALLSALNDLEKEVKSKRHSRAMAIYDRIKGTAIEQLLKDGRPVGVAKDLAKNIGAPQLEELTQVEDELSLIRSRIEVYQAVLNGWQSVYRHLAEASNLQGQG